MASGLKLHRYEICKYYLISDKCEACVVIDETPDNYYDQLNSKMRRRRRSKKTVEESCWDKVGKYSLFKSNLHEFTPR